MGEKGLLLRQYNNTVWCPSTICGAINYLCCPVWHLSLHVRPDQQERDMCSFNLVHQFDGHFFGLDSQLKNKIKIESSQNHLQSKVKNTYISFGHIHKSSLQQEITYTVLLSPFFTSYNCPYSVSWKEKLYLLSSRSSLGKVSILISKCLKWQFFFFGSTKVTKLYFFMEFVIWWETGEDTFITYLVSRWFSHHKLWLHLILSWKCTHSGNSG